MILASLSVRCMDTPIAKTVVAALGGNPVPINMSELYFPSRPAFVVGEENPCSNHHCPEVYEVQDAIVLTKHSVHLGTVEVSEQILAEPYRRTASGDYRCTSQVPSYYRR